jgi:hypothetical protein
MKKLRFLRAKLELVKNKFVEIENSAVNKHPEDQANLWDMYENTYKSIGMHLNKDTLFNKYDSWLVNDIDEDPNVDVFVTFTDTPWGKKMGVAGTDQSPRAKEAFKKAIATYLTKSGYYAELSLTMEYVAQKNGVPFIDNQEIVEEVLGGKSIEWEGDGYYSRQLGGMGNVSKRLYGSPKNVNQGLLAKSLKYKGDVKSTH